MKKPPPQSTSDLFGSLFGFLFKDDEDDVHHAADSTTIPPFRNITSTISLTDILNITNGGSKPPNRTGSIPQRINNKHFETAEPTTPMLEPPATTTEQNLNILRDVLLDTINSPAGSLLPSKPAAAIRHSSFYQLRPVFPQIRPEDLEAKHGVSDLNSIKSDLHERPDADASFLDAFSYSSSSVQHEGTPEYSGYSSSISRRPINPVERFALKQHLAEGAAQILTKPPSAGIDGMLKLAGCNIYGRMYRVGRIIAELSSACLECRCTEVGVHCTPLLC